MKKRNLIVIIMAASLMLASCSKTTEETTVERETTAATTKTTEETTKAEPTATPVPSVETTTATATSETSAADGILDEGFKGEWQRTNIHSAYPAYLTITDVEGNSFHFSLCAYNFTNSEDIEGDAYFVSENEAVYSEDNGDKSLYFTLDDEGLHLTSEDPYIWRAGNGAYPEGDYTTDEPDFTNANALEETYSQEELDTISSIFPEDKYNYYFLTVTNNGIITVEDVVLDDGTAARHIDCRFQGDGYSAVITEDGMIYISSQAAVSPSVITNDLDYSGDELPGFTTEE